MNVLLSSVGRRRYLVDYFKQALRGKGQVIATNCIAETTGMLDADVAKVVPPASDPAFLDAMLEVCKTHEVRLLLSLHDWEAPYIAKARDRFEAVGTIPVMPSSDVIDVCLDKYKTYTFARSNAIPTPRTHLELDVAMDEIDSGVMQFPVILKPRWGQGSVSLFKAETPEELRWTYQLIRSQLERSGLRRLAEEDPAHPIVIQQWVEGQEYGVDIVNDLQGNYVTTFVKRKIAMRSGETDVAETADCQPIVDVARRLSAWSRHLGNMDADFFVDTEGRVLLLEMNPRFGGGYPFSHVAGANLPAALLAWAENRDPLPEWLTIRRGVRTYKDIRMAVMAK